MSNDLISIQPETVNAIERMATAIAGSKLFGIKNKEEAMALMFISHAEGMHPAIAARDYHIVHGRPTLKADAMLSRFHQAGGSVQWHELNDKRAEATFSHPQGGIVKIDWDLARAATAQIKSDMWQKYPRQMLRARVISEGIRTVFPGVAVGTYTPEEAEDMEPVRQPKKPEPKPDAIDVDSTPVQEPLAADNPVLVKAQEEAKKGTDSYKVWWVANKHIWKDLKPHKPELKTIAELADEKLKPKIDRNDQLNDEIPEALKGDA